MTEIFWIYQVDLFMVNVRENTFRKHNLPTKAHELFACFILSFGKWKSGKKLENVKLWNQKFYDYCKSH